MSKTKSSVGDMPLMSRATTMNATHDNACPDSLSWTNVTHDNACPGVVRGKMTVYDTHWVGCCRTCGWYGIIPYAVEAV